MTTDLVTPSGMPGLNFALDAVNYSYGLGGATSSTRLFTPAGEELLCSVDSDSNTCPPAYLNNGWTAFSKPVDQSKGSAMAAFRRAPDGTVTSVSAPDVSTTAIAISSTGQVAMETAGAAPRRFLSNDGAAPTEISSTLGQLVWRSNGWYVFLGRTLFRVDVDRTDIDPDDRPSADGADAGSQHEPDAWSDELDAGPDRGCRASSGCVLASTTNGPSGWLLLTMLGWLMARRGRLRA